MEASPDAGVYTIFLVPMPYIGSFEHLPDLLHLQGWENLLSTVSTCSGHVQSWSSGHLHNGDDMHYCEQEEGSEGGH